MSSPRIFVAGGLRTPFARAGGVFAAHNAIGLSVEVMRAIESQRRPDTKIVYLAWGQVIPDPAVCNVVSICADGGQGPVVLLRKP